MAKKLICLLLCAVMLLPFASCAKGGTENEDAKAEAVTKEEETGRDAVHDDLPDSLNFAKREFRTLIQDTYKSDIWAENSDDNDIVSSAVYARNKIVEDRLNIVIAEPNAMFYDALSSEINKVVKSATNDYDLAMQHMIQAGNDALNNNFVDWYTVPYVDFTREWYPQFAIQGLTVNGKMLISVGDMLLATIDRTYCLFYDKKHAKNLGVDDVDQLALDGMWTVGKLTEYAGLAYQNLNGDNKANEGDYFGFANDCVNGYSVYYYAFDLDRVTIDEDYQVVMAYNDPSGKIIEAIEKLKKLMIRESTYCWQGNGMKDPIDIFMSQQALFCGGIIGEALSVVRTYENDYGIIPYPTYDEKQQNYYTIMGGGVSTMEVLRTVRGDEDLEFIGAVVEAMSSETWRSVIPPYYDVALKFKGARDEQSVKLMDIILDSRAVDVAIAYDGWLGLTYKLKDFIHTNKNWTSAYKGMERSVTKHYKDVAKLFEGLDENK